MNYRRSEVQRPDAATQAAVADHFDQCVDRAARPSEVLRRKAALASLQVQQQQQQQQHQVDTEPRAIPKRRPRPSSTEDSRGTVKGIVSEPESGATNVKCKKVWRPTRH